MNLWLQQQKSHTDCGDALLCRHWGPPWDSPPYMHTKYHIHGKRPCQRCIYSYVWVRFHVILEPICFHLPLLPLTWRESPPLIIESKALPPGCASIWDPPPLVITIILTLELLCILRCGILTVVSPNIPYTVDCRFQLPPHYTSSTTDDPKTEIWHKNTHIP